MDIETNRQATTIHLGEAYCFNFDKAIEACLLLCAREYWKVHGKRMLESFSNPMAVHYSREIQRTYLRIKYALDRFEGMSESEIFDGMAYDQSRVRKYYGAMQTLWDLRGYMWI